MLIKRLVLPHLSVYRFVGSVPEEQEEALRAYIGVPNDINQLARVLVLRERYGDEVINYLGHCVEALRQRLKLSHDALLAEMRIYLEMIIEGRVDETASEMQSPGLHKCTPEPKEHAALRETLWRQVMFERKPGQTLMERVDLILGTTVLAGENEEDGNNRTGQWYEHLSSGSR